MNIVNIDREKIKSGINEILMPYAKEKIFSNKLKTLIDQAIKPVLEEARTHLSSLDYKVEAPKTTKTEDEMSIAMTIRRPVVPGEFIVVTSSINFTGDIKMGTVTIKTDHPTNEIVLNNIDDIDVGVVTTHVLAEIKNIFEEFYTYQNKPK